MGRSGPHRAGVVALAAAATSLDKLRDLLAAAEPLAAAELQETQAEIDELLDQFEPAE
jgi:hypothetical protein